MTRDSKRARDSLLGHNYPQGKVKQKSDFWKVDREITGKSRNVKMVNWTKADGKRGGNSK